MEYVHISQAYVRTIRIFKLEPENTAITGPKDHLTLKSHSLINTLLIQRHLVFTCPALEHVRLRYRHLFTSRTDTMVQFLWQDDLISVARFIADCFDDFQSGGYPS
jgi:hypothetical protein